MERGSTAPLRISAASGMDGPMPPDTKGTMAGVVRRSESAPMAEEKSRT